MTSIEQLIVFTRAIAVAKLLRTDIVVRVEHDCRAIIELKNRKRMVEIQYTDLTNVTAEQVESAVNALRQLLLADLAKIDDAATSNNGE